VDGPLLDLARLVMGQAETAKKGSALLEAWAPTPPANGGGEDPTTTGTSTGTGTGTTTGTSALAPIGRGGVATTVHSRWLQRWQRVWLAALRGDSGDRGGGGSVSDPHGSSCATPGAFVPGEPDLLMTCVGSAATGIDPRVWAYLRVLYAESEDDLRRHGYSPTTLQSPSAMLDGPTERRAIRTLIGILGVALSSYETDLKDDCTQLRLGVLLSGRGDAGATGTGTDTDTGTGAGSTVMNESKRGGLRDPVKTARRLLRQALGVAPPPPPPLSVQLMGMGLGVSYFFNHQHHHHHHHHRLPLPSPRFDAYPPPPLFSARGGGGSGGRSSPDRGIVHAGRHGHGHECGCGCGCGSRHGISRS
jgi:hypothetical protein